MSIRILTDSTADLAPEMIRRYNIKIQPLYVNFGPETVVDGELTQAAFLEKIRQSQEFPKTSHPSPADFVRTFRELLATGDEIIYIGLSSAISGTMSSAALALNELGDVPVSLVNSRNLSMGIGLLVLHAAAMAEAGKSRQEIVAELERLVPKVRTAFIVDTLDFLHKGGRLSAIGAFVGNILNIHPLVAMVDGRLTILEKVRGRRDRALQRLLDWALADPNKIRPEWVSVTHVACPDDAQKLMTTLREQNSLLNLVTTEAGAVITSHCGPNTIGILFIEK
ncbi:MAG TPA: DegV family protein [Firmicutes bacterium]|jgi:DegV family protein with EDD domain|nr:DegV family protein [Bacillota bacterium]HOQ24882.1 DegV family protein [Bacillota bacterium]HPT68259.1 DegV family protein [Bacillota bacterium]